MRPFTVDIACHFERTMKTKVMKYVIFIGQTSSQAQIGFRPESGENNKISNTFNGGGQASAQSGVHSGQSQSQIHGNFK